MTLDFLEDAVDLHVHSAPDLDRRRFNDIELAREAARVGMGAILIKSHQNSTVERAFLVSQIVPEIRVYGGLVLNETVGGLNPAAVRLAISMGAKQIWMPTRSAANHCRHHSLSGGISVLDPNGRLRFLKEMAHSRCILGTGHLSPKESSVLIARASSLGIQKLLVTHPEWAPTYYSVEAQKELSSQATYSLSAVSYPPPIVAVLFRLKQSGGQSAMLASAQPCSRQISANLIRRHRPKGFGCTPSDSTAAAFPWTTSG